MTTFRIGWLAALVGAMPVSAQPIAYPEIRTAREQRDALEFSNLGGSKFENRESRIEEGHTIRSSIFDPRSSIPGPRSTGTTLTTSEEKSLLQLLADEAFPGISEDVRLLQKENFGTTQTWVIAGKTGSAVLATGAVAAGCGVDLVGSVAPVLAEGTGFVAISQWAGPVGYAALSAYEGFTVWQWDSGWLTNRQFARHQAHFLGGIGLGVAGGLGGLKAGAVTGGFVGAFFGPAGVPVGVTIGAAIGVFGGGLAGGVLGSGLSRHAINRWFEFKDRQQEAEYLRFLRSHYGLPPSS